MAKFALPKGLIARWARVQVYVRGGIRRRAGRFGDRFPVDEVN